MKLRQINENLVMQQVRGQLLRSGPYATRPYFQTGQLYDASRGFDAGARMAGATYLPSGIPHKPRHRQFLGLETRPGTIRL
jgi:hypothetical protein